MYCNTGKPLYVSREYLVFYVLAREASSSQSPNVSRKMTPAKSSKKDPKKKHLQILTPTPGIERKRFITQTNKIQENSIPQLNKDVSY